MRVSNDNGETFGPTLKISKNGTIDEGGMNKQQQLLDRIIYCSNSTSIWKTI
jgi:hypothetical protein